MDKEQITKILSKIKDTVGENNYKLALAITGHRTGKIKDIIMCSKDGELLLEYVEQLEQQSKKQKEVIDKTTNIINDYLKEDYSIYTENEIEVDLIVKLKNILKEVSEWIKKKYWDYVNF